MGKGLTILVTASAVAVVFAVIVILVDLGYLAPKRWIGRFCDAPPASLGSVLFSVFCSRTRQGFSSLQCMLLSEMSLGLLVGAVLVLPAVYYFMCLHDPFSGYREHVNKNSIHDNTRLEDARKPLGMQSESELQRHVRTDELLRKIVLALFEDVDPDSIVVYKPGVVVAYKHGRRGYHVHDSQLEVEYYRKGDKKTHVLNFEFKKGFVRLNFEGLRSNGLPVAGSVDVLSLEAALMKLEGNEMTGPRVPPIEN